MKVTPSLVARSIVLLAVLGAHSAHAQTAPGNRAPTQSAAPGVVNPGINAAGAAAAQPQSTERQQFDVNGSSEEAMRSELGLSVGEARALSEYRQREGRLSSDAQLDAVTGLSADSRERMRNRLRYDGSPGGVAPTTGRETTP